MDLKKELTREGVRGGQEQFKWDSLKSMPNKQREHYLGYTTKVGYNGAMGQFNKNDWWRTKKSESSEKGALEIEKHAAKLLERELMNEALGLKPQRLILAKNQLSADEVTSVLKREEASDVIEKRHQHDNVTNDEETAVSAVSGVRGLGFDSYGRSNPIKIYDEDDEDLTQNREGIPLAVKPEVKLERARSRSRSQRRLGSSHHR